MTDLGGLLLSEGDDSTTINSAVELFAENYQVYKNCYTSTDMHVLLKRYPKLFREPLPILFERGHFAISQNCLGYHLL
jgi:hypothetical protein